MSQEKLKILKMIENKIISVDEGLRLLDSLKDEKDTENVVIIDKDTTTVKQEKIKGKSSINLGKGIDHEEYKNMEKPLNFEKLGKQINESIGSGLGQLGNQLSNIENLSDMIEEKLSGLNEWGKKVDENANKWGKKVDQKANKWSEKVEQKANSWGDKVNSQSNNWEKNVEKWATKLGSTIEKGVEDMQEELKKNQVKKQYLIKTQGDPVSNINLINIELRSGDVEVITEARKDICIEALGYGGEDVTLELLDIKDVDGIINITQDPNAKSKATFFGILHIERDVDILIRLPHNYQKNLSIKTQSGDLAVRNIGIKGLEFNSVSGSVEGGDMMVESCVIKTISGDITIANFYGELLFSTTSGDVDANIRSLDYDINGRCISGDVAFYIPSDAEFGLSLRSTSGHMNCDFPVTMLGGNLKNKMRGKVVNDKHNINVETTSGDIDIKRYKRQ